MNKSGFPEKVRQFVRETNSSDKDGVSAGAGSLMLFGLIRELT